MRMAPGVALTGDEDRPPEPRVTVHRKRDAVAETFDAGLDTEIRPGDVLEVSIAPVPAG